MRYVGMTVEEIVAKGFKLVEENVDGEGYDIYGAYWGEYVWVEDGVVGGEA